MKIAIDNKAQGAAFVAVPASGTQDISVVSDGSFSSVYTDALTSTVITATAASSSTIEYVAIGGSNISTKSTLEIKVGATTILNTSSLSFSDSRTIFVPCSVASDTVEITITGSGTLAVADISFGSVYDVPNGGEQSGYSRIWSKPNVESRAATNLQGSPVAMLHQSTALKASLSVPNNLMVNFDDWYEMIEYAASNNFYIIEDDDMFHSYVCFDGKPDMTKAHGQTRSLGQSVLKFSAYSKSSEVFL